MYYAVVNSSIYYYAICKSFCNHHMLVQMHRQKWKREMDLLWCIHKLCTCLCCSLLHNMAFIKTSYWKLASSWVLVLVFTGIELIFLVMANMVLYSRFVTKTVLATHPCFSYCCTALTEHQGLSCFSCYPARKLAGVPKKLGGDTATTADPIWPKGFSTSSSVIKLGVRKNGRHPE